MKATSFPQFNINLGAGGNPNTNDLPVALCHCDCPEYQDVAFMFSCFKPNEEELALINKMGEIWLGVMCSKPTPHPEYEGKLFINGTMPPVIVAAHNPFTQTEPPYKPYDAELFLK